MSSLQTWTESIVLGVTLVVLFGIVISGMNVIHSQNFNIAGLPTDSYQKSINDYQALTQAKMSGGAVSFTSVFGLTLLTSWDVLVNTMSLLWGFISGGWIRTILIDYMMMPDIVGWAAQAIFLMSITWLIIKLLFRIKA